MALPDGIHEIQLTIALEDPTVRLHPAAVETDRGVLLIDAGFPGSVDQIEAGLENAGFGWEDVWGVVLTHQDVDHAGGLADVVERANPVVFAHRECAPYVDGREHPIKLDGERYPAVPVDVELTAGVQFDTLAGPMAVVFTPGHAPGHVSLYVADEAFLISGDALHAPEGHLDGPRGPLDEGEAVASIRTLAGFDVERTLCHHGGIVPEGTDAIEAILGEE